MRHPMEQARLDAMPDVFWSTADLCRLSRVPEGRFAAWKEAGMFRAIDSHHGPRSYAMFTTAQVRLAAAMWDKISEHPDDYEIFIACGGKLDINDHSLAFMEADTIREVTK